MTELSIDQLDDITVVTMPNEGLYRLNSAGFMRAMASILWRHSTIVFDMSRLHFLDTCGLSSLLWCLGRLKEKGRRLNLCGVRNEVSKTLDLTRLQTVFDIFETRDEAIQAIRATEVDRIPILVAVSGDGFISGAF